MDRRSRSGALLDPRHLRVLIEVAKHGSYAGAARALGYTQPAIGQQIQTLERHVRAPVVVRSGRTVLLTDVGRMLVEQGRGVLELLAAMEDEIDSMAGAERGTVRILLTATPMQLLAPRALRTLKESRPGLTVSIAQAHSQPAIEGLRAGEADIAVVVNLPEQSALREAGLVTELNITADLAGLGRVPLFSDELILLVPRGHRLAGAGRARMSDIARELVITGGAEFDTGRFFSQWPDSAPVIAATNVLAVRDLVAAEHGVAVMGSATASSIAHDAVVAVPFSPSVRRDHVALFWNRLGAVQPIRLALRALTDAAGRLPQH